MNEHNFTLVRKRLSLFKRYRHTISVKTADTRSVIDWLVDNLNEKVDVNSDRSDTRFHSFHRIYHVEPPACIYVVKFTNELDAVAFTMRFSEVIVQN